jgi:hypothetical protein
MNAFHVLGGLFAAWAVLVAFLGITRENFPGSRGAMLAVQAISILLAAGAMFSAIYVGITEEDEDEGGKKERAALSAPR